MYTKFNKLICQSRSLFGDWVEAQYKINTVVFIYPPPPHTQQFRPGAYRLISPVWRQFDIIIEGCTVHNIVYGIMHSN